jgi:putative FmdB family regulatory protein
MPTYVYRREDGTKFEYKQSITDDPLEKCPETGQDVERLITGSTGLIFKGEGFYVNDYGKGSGKNGSKGEAADAANGEAAEAGAEAGGSDAGGSEAAGGDA